AIETAKECDAAGTTMRDHLGGIRPVGRNADGAEAQMDMALVAPMDGEEAVLELNALGLAGALELIGGADQQGTPAQLVMIVVEHVGEQRAEESFIHRQRPDVFSSSIRAADPLS